MKNYTAEGFNRAQKFIGVEHRMLIGGKFVPAKSGRTIEVVNPATTEVVGQIPQGGAEDVDAAVRAARKAFENGPWRQMKGPERTEALWKLADLISRHEEELGIIEATDVGQPISFARFGNVGASIPALKYYAGWAGRLYGEVIPETAAGDWLCYSELEPVGVVAQINPWNVPFSMAVTKLAPALAAGCSVVMKPAELTSLSALRLAELIQEAGFPDGLINVVTGYGHEVGQALVDHPGIDKIAFTGSTATGKAIMRASAERMTRVTMELGGKAPVLILDDADVEKAGTAAARSLFGNSGQACTAGSRIYIDRKVAEPIVAQIVEYARSLKVGNPFDDGVQMGPVVSEAQMKRVIGYIESGKRQGAELLFGGEPAGDKGYFVSPTVFTRARPDMTMVREEIFGPVITFLDMDSASLDSLAAQANDTHYGLAAVIWSQDISRAHKLARKIRAGSVRINTSGNVDPAVPFGGFKQSGFGRERGRDGVEIYTEKKMVSVAL